MKIDKSSPRTMGVTGVVMAAMLLLFCGASEAQTSHPPQKRPPASESRVGTVPADAIAHEFDKYPGLLEEFGRLFMRLHDDVKFPDSRHQGDMLPMVDASANYYIGMPNYGEAAHQTLTIFRDELQQSAVLRKWWQSDEVAKAGKEFESSVEKFSQLSQYLGEEIVVSGEIRKEKPTFAILARVRKPGFKECLEQIVKDQNGKMLSGLRILDEKGLASANSSSKQSDLIVVVRPDFVLVGADLETVRKLNSRLGGKNDGFADTQFRRKVDSVYASGTSVLAVGDLHKIVTQMAARDGQNEKKLEQLGFDNVEYLSWNYKQVSDRSVGETELSFDGPRHGVAGWLAAPAPLGSLDFVSPESALAMTVVLKNPGEIFDDLQRLSQDTKQGPFGALPQMEKVLQISVRDDILAQLAGEITLEVESVGVTPPGWKAILRVNDAERLQRSLAKVLQTVPFPSREFEQDGVVYHALSVPSNPKPVEINYAFADGYLIVASGKEIATRAIQLHKTGESLGKSPKFLASLPPGHSANASVLIYEDVSAMAAVQARNMPPELAKLFSGSSLKPTAVSLLGYGEPSSIRAVSAGGGANSGAIMVVAAIAIPNLLRARIAANEASAVAAVRTVNTAQVSYAAEYPERGFARNLATLGPGLEDPRQHSVEHASLIDASLGGAGCEAGNWCTKDGYRFMLKGTCLQSACREYVVVATPISSGTGTRSFCSVSDAVVRVSMGPILTSPITPTECRRWTPLQ